MHALPSTVNVGFPPVYRSDAQLLLLGTLPGQRSLACQQYYGHPHNQFWPIMQALLGIPTDAEYTRRVTQLMEAKIALWDVCHSASRKGSLDSAIIGSSVLVNPVDGLIATLPALRCIAFNGQAAATLFRRHRLSNAALPTLVLPSTSPAHARLRFAQKLAQWQAINAFLTD